MSSFISHPVPAVILLLGLLVFFHELGHFVVGRWCGIAVETFSIGFGPRLLGFRWRGTDYRLSWLPLGGYVKFAGAHPSEEVPEGLVGGAYLAAPVFKRALTVMAGPLANFLLAVVVYAVLGHGGIPHPPAQVGEVLEGSAAERAGLRSGDVVIAIDGKAIGKWRDLEERIAAAPGKDLALIVRRGGAEERLTLTPEPIVSPALSGRKVTMGRAGIALARPPSIIAVLGSASPAAVAGLRTGDRIVGVEGAADGSDGVVNSYPQLVARLRARVQQGQASVNLQVAATMPPKLDGEGGVVAAATSDQGTSRRVSLPLAAASGLGQGGARAMMAALGLADATLTVAAASDGAAASLKPGDVLLAWGDAELKDLFALRDQLLANAAPAVTLTIQRGGEPITVHVNLKGIEAQRPEGAQTIHTLPVLFWGQPVDPDPVIERYDTWTAAVTFGVGQTLNQTKELLHNIANIFTGEIPLRALGGPMLIAKVAGDSARRGLQTFLGSMALVSINLGLLNLFPIPVLDGGQLLLLGAEGLRRRPLREAAVENFQKVGFALIMALVVLATYNDLSRFWRSMLESVMGLFQ